jgi:hypothetical protein
LGEIDIVKTLLELGSDPNIANVFDGNHPLFILAKSRPQGNAKTSFLADILLDAGSNPLHGVRYEADSANRLDATQTPSFNETALLCCSKSFISSTTSNPHHFSSSFSKRRSSEKIHRI